MLYPEAAVERAMKRQEVICRALAGTLTWLQAADILGIDPRSLRRWRARYQADGVLGLYDRPQLPSPRKAPIVQGQHALRLYPERYRGWNVRPFYRFARRDHALRLSYSFVKPALQEAGLVRKRPAPARSASTAPGRAASSTGCSCMPSPPPRPPTSICANTSPPPTTKSSPTRRPIPPRPSSRSAPSTSTPSSATKRRAPSGTITPSRSRASSSHSPSSLAGAPAWGSASPSPAISPPRTPPRTAPAVSGNTMPRGGHCPPFSESPLHGQRPSAPTIDVLGRAHIGVSPEIALNPAAVAARASPCIPQPDRTDHVSKPSGHFTCQQQG